MKRKIIKLFFLLVTMSVLTSSKEDTRTNNAKPACLDTKNDYAVNISCAQAPVVTDKCDDTNIMEEDNEISLSPISRFILLQ